ncbi:MAG: protease complex subunit PrcB family protein [Cyanobacteria bacterium SBC]|nr:protease complex subunit PrcB family protein [Cyanobacteria bacterium SBC]
MEFAMNRSIALVLTLLPIVALPALPTRAATEPVLCAATATPTQVPWGSRYSYWLQGVAEFDSDGRLLPISPNRASEWSLVVTSGRNPAPATFSVNVIDSATAPEFAFPAITSIEWQTLNEQPTSNATSTFSAQGVTDGLFLAIRNPQRPGIQPLFQVIHYLAPNFSIVSEASVCFVGVTAIEVVQQPQNTGAILPFETLERGRYSGFNQAFERVVNDRLAWRNFWRQLQLNVSPTPELPEIDFDNTTVIGVGLGDRASGAYRVEIDTIRLANDTVVVNYTERRSCGISTMAITQPYHLVTIDRTTAPVEFRRSVDAPVCEPR